MSRTRNRPIKHLAALGIFLSLALPSSAQTPPRYTVTDLGSLGGQECAATGLNNQGQVVGQSKTSHGQKHAFIWSQSKIRDLGTLPGSNSSKALAINNLGQVVGYSEGLPSGHYQTHGFLWRNGRMICLAKADGSDSIACSINDRGQVVGETELWVDAHRTSFEQAFLWQNGEMSFLNTRAGDDSWARAINNKGQILYTTTAGNRGLHLALWDKGTVHIFNVTTGGYEGDAPFSFNNHGEFFGQKLLQGYGVGDTYLWKFGRPMGKISRKSNVTSLITFGLNDRDNAVGQCVFQRGQLDTDEGGFPFLWRKEKTYDLNKLISTHSGWLLEQVCGINNRGQIVGNGLHKGKSRAFLLTPNLK